MGTLNTCEMDKIGTASVETDLSESAFVILQTAVSEVRAHQIRSLQSLREHLARLFPGYTDDIEKAIAFWAAYVRRTGVNA